MTARRRSVQLRIVDLVMEAKAIMDKKALEQRTKVFALRAIRFIQALPRDKVADVIGHQLLKSATAIGANYREANRAESHNDFVHKLSIVEKEASETYYWLELCVEASVGDSQERAWLFKECDELLAIFTAAGRTAKANRVTRR
jgi:four helix bundle protein